MYLNYFIFIGYLSPRRYFGTPSDEPLPTSPAEGVLTLYDILQYCIKTHGESNAIAYRDLVKEHIEEKQVTGHDGKPTSKKWTYFELSDYKWLTWPQVLHKVNNIGSGLSHLGLSKDTIFNIYGQTALVTFLIAFNELALMVCLV